MWSSIYFDLTVLSAKYGIRIKLTEIFCIRQKAKTLVNCLQRELFTFDILFNLVNSTQIHIVPLAFGTTMYDNARTPVRRLV